MAYNILPSTEEEARKAAGFYSAIRERETERVDDLELIKLFYCFALNKYRMDSV